MAEMAFLQNVTYLERGHFQCEPTIVLQLLKQPVILVLNIYTYILCIEILQY